MSRFSFLAPLWLADVLGEPLRGLGRSIPIAHNTVKLLIIGVVGFAAGATIRFRPSGRAARQPIAPVSPRRMLNLGRGLLLVPLAISVERFAAGAVQHRGLNGLAATPTGALSALIDPTQISALILILTAHRLAKRDKLMARLDWILVGALHRGDRGARISRQCDRVAARS